MPTNRSVTEPIDLAPLGAVSATAGSAPSRGARPQAWTPEHWVHYPLRKLTKMKPPKKILMLALAAFSILAISACVQAAGFQRGLAADPDGKPLQIGIWYPSLDTPAPLTIGTTTMTVAPNGAVQGQALPLVVVSHGTGSSYLGHAATAVALADAGYVVVAVTHTGDNHADQSRSAFIMDRPRHISRVLDHVLSTWENRAVIDATRIGVFGYSAGGFTALVSVGGIADLASVGPMCQQYPGDFACQLLARSGRAPAEVWRPVDRENPVKVGEGRHG